jgi:peptidyl-prolyl cis-trans isomerase SurA
LFIACCPPLTENWRQQPICAIIGRAEIPRLKEIPMKRVFWIIPAILFGFCLSEARVVDRILAQVNDEVITLSELNRRMAKAREELAAKYTGEQLAEMIQKEEKETLDDLILEKLLYQKSVEIGYTRDTDPEVSEIIQKIMQDNNIKDMDQLETVLAQDGRTVKDLRDQFRRQIISEDLIREFVGSRIIVLMPEIEKYYKDHAAEFTSPEEVSLSEIVLTDEGAENQANDLYRRLQQGEAFATLASQYSKGPTANKGGNTGTYLVSALKAEEANAIAGLKEGEISKPQKTKDGYVIYRIDSRVYATTRPLEEVKDKIKDEIFMKKFYPERQRFFSKLKEEAYWQIFSETK